MIFLLKSALFSGAMSLAGLMIFLYCCRSTFSRALGRKLISVLAYCTIIVWASPTMLIHQVAAFLIVPLFGRARGQAAGVYMFSLLIMPGVSYVLQSGGIYLFVWDNFLSISFGALLTVMMVDRRRGRAGSVAVLASMFAIFAVFLLPGMRETTITNVMRIMIEQSCLILLPFYTLHKSVKTPQDLRPVLLCLVAASAALSSLALYEARSAWPIFRAAYEHYGIPMASGNSVKMRGGLLRAPGPFPEPTSFAIWLSFGAFVALTGRWMFASRAKHLMICGLLLVGMFAPQSRGAWLGLIAAYLIYQIGTGRVGAMLKGVSVAAILGIVGYVAALNIPLLGNMLGLDEKGVIGPDYRQQLFTRGLEEAQHNLLLGTDLASVMASLSDLRQGEGIIDFVNTYLYVLLVSGIVGLVAFSLGLLVPIGVMWQKAATLPREGKPLPSVIAALIGSLAVMIFFTSLTGRSTMGVAVLLGLGASISRMKPAEFATRAGAAVGRRPASALASDPAPAA